MPASLGAAHRTLPLWAKALLLAAGYLVAAEAGNLISVQTQFATFWPPAGLFLAVLLISRPREWPVLIAAGIAGNICSDLLHGRALLVTMGFSTANALEAVLGAWLLTVLIGRRPTLGSMKEAFSLGAVGAVVAPLVGSAIGATIVVYTTPGAEWLTVWFTWYSADVLGILLFGSVVLAGVGLWDAHRARPGIMWRTVLLPLGRSLLVAVPFMVLAFAVFSPSGGATSWKFTVVPGIITCAITGGPLGAAVGLLLIAGSALAGMAGGTPHSVLAGSAGAVSVLQAQAFFAVTGVTALCLAGVIAESRGHAIAAREASQRFRLLFDTMNEGVAYCRIIFDADGRAVDWIYLQVNDAFEHLTGLHDLVGRHSWEVLPDLAATAPEIYEAYGRVASTGRPEVFETSARIPGRIMRLSVTSPARGDIGEVMEDVTERVAGEAALAESNKRLEKMVYDVAAAMGSVVEARDPYTQGHEVRVSDLARRIAEEMGLAEDDLDGISMAGLLHDIGKLRIPAEILTKPGMLSTAEFSLIREHPRQGFEILNHIEFPWPVAETVLRHHERLDGSGYPDGLRDAEIPLTARILAVADVVEAMSSHRPYRPMVGVDQAIEEISDNPQRYDREVVAACVRLHQRGALGL